MMIRRQERHTVEKTQSLARIEKSFLGWLDTVQVLWENTNGHKCAFPILKFNLATL